MDVLLSEKCKCYRLILNLAVLLSVLTACSENTGFDGIRFADGSIYHGEMQDGILHGRGGLVFVNGSRYQGQFMNGVFHGNGSFFYYNGDVYHGEFKNGVATGKGIYTTKSGIIYEGDFFQGAANGTVKITNKKARIKYEGQVHQWLFSGFGNLVKGKTQYQGHFLNNVYHGKGTLADDKGSYSGEFVEGMYNGLGVYEIEGATYRGEFMQGAFTGFGTLHTANDEIYMGEFKDWNLQGNGKAISKAGDVYIGYFEDSVLTGKGQFTSFDGEQYSGEFNYGQFDGSGVLVSPDGSKYKGEFSYGRYHGQGKLEKTVDNGVGLEIKQGRWEYGRLVENEITGVNVEVQPEIALENHQVLLNKAISKLKQTDPDNRNLYFLGLGGDGTQSVFRREVEYVGKQLAGRFDIEGRGISLINDHETAEKYPLATIRSFTQSVNAIAEKMDKDNDVLFLYLTSHGSKDHELSLGHDSIKLPDMPASTIKEVLKKSGIKWKAIVVSACYSGGFIPELNDGTSLILTAADADKTSFGCSDDSTMTYFGKALFKEVFAKESKVNFKKAFLKAKDIIETWEKEEDLEPSNPLIKEQEDVIKFLQSMSN